jgi:TP901 family phage tail tape measure protein
MADRIKGITVEIGGDTTGLSKALSGVNKEIRNTQSQLTDVNRLLKLDPTNSELLSQKQKLLSQAVGETKEKLTQLKSVQDQMDAGLKNGSVTQEQYDAWQREIIATEQELKGLEQQCKKTDTSVSATLKQAGSKMQEVGGKISEVGEGLTTHVTAPIVAVGAASLAAFSEVDSGLDIVEQKTGATGQTLEDMNQTVKDLATEIPTDFETAGAAVGEVNTRFGLTGQALDDLSGKFIKFADLNNTDVSTSVDNVSGVLNAFGQDASDAGDLLDAMNATGQATGIDMDTLASALQTNAVQLKELGLNSQQAAGFMGMVEMSGLDTSAAMMGLKTAMKNATKDGKTLDQAIASFSTTMKGNGSETEKLQAAYDLFGSKAGAAIYNACATGKLNLDNLSGSLGNFSGSVENTFNETLDPIDQFKMTMNSLKETGADIGNSLASALAPVLKDISNALKSFSQIWNGIPEPVQQVIIKVALIAAAIGPLLVVIGKVISAVGTITSVIGTLTPVFGALNAVMLANPIILIIAAIAALVAAFIYLWNNCDGFRQFWIDLWEGIKQTVITVFTAIKDFFVATWQAIQTVFTTVVTAIGTFLTTAWNTIKTTVETVMTAIQTVISTIWNGIKAFFETIFTAIQLVVTTYFEIYKTIITTVLTAISVVATTIWNAIKAVVTIVVSAIQTFITTAWNTIQTVTSTVFNAIHTVFTTVWNGIKSVVMGVVNAMQTGISTAFNAIHNTISGILNGIKDVFSSVFNGIWNFVSGIVDKLKGIFNFNWELPKIKLPHFSISGSFSLDPPSIPHFSVDWYKKAMGNGMILDSPTIFGMSGNSLLAGGEAGAEAVVGVSSLQAMIQNAVASQTGTMVNALSAALENVGGGGDITIPVYLGGTLLDETIITAQQRMALRSGGR